MPDVYKRQPFDCEEDAIEAVISRKIQPGDAVFIRSEGPKGSGMPEMFYTTEAISSDPEPVSYTHLDVYKRQEYHSGNGRSVLKSGTCYLSGVKNTCLTQPARAVWIETILHH